LPVRQVPRPLGQILPARLRHSGGLMGPGLALGFKTFYYIDNF